ncbi:MAG TPA: folate-binding protein, partial [Methyloceanibacter sp.]|nr:folate-binding protein [Methyloceanibacter sp.]
MSKSKVTRLRDRGILRVSGSAARTFLQGLITNDINKAKPGNAIYAGLLTPQGKILFDFFVVPAEDGFLLDVANAKAAELMQRLGFYQLRAQVEIVEDPSFTVAASWESS